METEKCVSAGSVARWPATPPLRGGWPGRAQITLSDVTFPALGLQPRGTSWATGLGPDRLLRSACVEPVGSYRKLEGGDGYRRGRRLSPTSEESGRTS